MATLIRIFWQPQPANMKSGRIFMQRSGDVAEKEGFKDIAVTFRNVAEVEKTP